MVNPVGQRGHISPASQQTLAQRVSVCRFAEITYILGKSRQSVNQKPIYKLARSPIRAAFSTENG